MAEKNTTKEPENKEPEKVEISTAVEKSGEVLETPKPVQDGEKTGKDPVTGKFLPNNTFGGSHPDSNGKISLRKKLIEMLPTILKGQSIPCFQAILFSLMVRAINGDMQAMKLIWQYTEGNPMQFISISAEIDKKDAEEEKEVNPQVLAAIECWKMQFKERLKPVIYEEELPEERNIKKEKLKPEPVNPSIRQLPNGASVDDKGPAIESR